MVDCADIPFLRSGSNTVVCVCVYVCNLLQAACQLDWTGPNISLKKLLNHNSADSQEGIVFRN